MQKETIIQGMLMCLSYLEYLCLDLIYMVSHKIYYEQYFAFSETPVTLACEIWDFAFHNMCARSYSHLVCHKQGNPQNSVV